MKILITGVLGVVGSKLEKELKKRGHITFGIDLWDCARNYGHQLGKVRGDDYTRCNVSHYRELEDVVEYFKPDLVYHAAANFGRWSGERHFEDVWNSNAIGTKNVVRLQEKHKFKLVHFSSSEVYGDTEEVMTEDLLTKVPIMEMNDYAMSKVVNEWQISNSRTQFDTKTVIVRLFNTYGPEEWYSPFRSVNCRFCFDLLNNRQITVFAGHTRTSTYINDAVNAVANISENFKNGEIYNIASSQYHSIEELASLCVLHTNTSAELINWVDKHEILTTKHKRVDNTKAVRDLGFKETVTLSDGVCNTVEWMKSYYNL